MPNPITLRFLSDLKKKNLKFPVAELSKKLGYPKSNVSEFLSGKKEPSDKFIVKFYEVYYPDMGITETMMLYEPEEKITNAQDTIRAMQATIDAQKETIDLLKQRIEDLEHAPKPKNAGGRRS